MTLPAPSSEIDFPGKPAAGPGHTGLQPHNFSVDLTKVGVVAS
jgi:hypothetical protein